MTSNPPAPGSQTASSNTLGRSTNQAHHYVLGIGNDVEYVIATINGRMAEDRDAGWEPV